MSKLLFSDKTFELKKSLELRTCPKKQLKRVFECSEELLPFYRKSFLANDSQAFLPEDLRGRAPENFGEQDEDRPLLVSSAEYSPPVQREELLLIKGRIELPRPSRAEQESGAEPEILELPFSFSVRSQFERFLGSSHILYRYHFSHSLGLEQHLELPSLSCLLLDDARLKIDFARLGLEFFSASFLGSIVGAVPKVKARFYLEIKGHQMQVFLQDRGKNDQLSDARLLKLTDSLGLCC